MSKKVKISKLTPEQIENFKHSISSIIENYEPINKTITQVITDVYKQLEPIKIQMTKIQIEPVNYKTMIDSISDLLSSSQKVGFQKFILDKPDAPIDEFYELENERSQITQSEQNNNELVENVKINQININIHNHYPPNKLNVFNLISNLILLLEFLKIINAPEETIKLVTDFIKNVLELIK